MTRGVERGDQVNGDECAGRELVRGQAAAARFGFPLIWGHNVMGTPRAYKFFVKISACRLNLSTPEARNVENKGRIYAIANRSPAGCVNARDEAAN